MTGLETLGVRPAPVHRGATATYIWRRLDWLYRYERPSRLHSLFWGVPCGPTRSMVHPHRVVGIR